MQKIYIETKYQGNLDLPKGLIEELPQRVMLAATVQFIDQLPEVKKKLTAYGKEAYLFVSAHGRHPGQILGCDNFIVKKETDCFLYIGDGRFHPTALLANEKPVFCYNPFSERWDKLGRKEWEEYRLKKKVGLMKFHSAQNIGILISTKEGQKNVQGRAEQLKEILEQKGKNAYLFLCNEVKDLENFNFIDCWVNTACPRISGDFENVVNLKDL